jgi:hypothetical protein
MTSIVWDDSAIVITFVSFLRVIGEYKLAMNLEISFYLLNDTTGVLSDVDMLFDWVDEGVNPFHMCLYQGDKDLVRDFTKKR